MHEKAEGLQFKVVELLGNQMQVERAEQLSLITIMIMLLHWEARSKAMKIDTREEIPSLTQSNILRTMLWRQCQTSVKTRTFSTWHWPLMDASYALTSSSWALVPSFFASFCEIIQRQTPSSFCGTCPLMICSTFWTLCIMVKWEWNKQTFKISSLWRKSSAWEDCAKMSHQSRLRERTHLNLKVLQIQGNLYFKSKLSIKDQVNRQLWISKESNTKAKSTFSFLFPFLGSVPRQRPSPIVHRQSLGNVLKITQTSGNFKLIDSSQKRDFIKEKFL